MPPRGVRKGTKRARQYEHIKDSLEEQGKSEGLAEEIAALAVNKERARSGEAKTSHALARGHLSGRRGGIRSGARNRLRPLRGRYAEARARNSHASDARPTQRALAPGVAFRPLGPRVRRGSERGPQVHATSATSLRFTFST